MRVREGYELVYEWVCVVYPSFTTKHPCHPYTPHDGCRWSLRQVAT